MIPESTFDYLTVLSMPQVSLNSYKSLLFHGGDTGSISVRDAKNTINKLHSHCPNCFIEW